jgi:long-chain acyl-CoA synthetase
MTAATDTLVSLLCRQKDCRGPHPALYVYRNDGFSSITWGEYFDDVCRYAAALVQLGVRAGDRVAQVSENRYEWIVLDLAVHACQAVHVAMHCSLSGPQIAEQVTDCEPVLIIASEPDQTEKLAAVAERLPVGVEVISHCRLRELAGEANIDEGRALVERAVAELGPQSLATILYTSGTTGEPKGVMLSHGNLTSNAHGCCIALGADSGPDTLRLCWLPLSHIYARTSDMYCWLRAGSQMALARSRDTLIADCATTRPTFINGVPYFYDKLLRHLQSTGHADEPGALLALLGGRMRACCAGGAALSDETARFFQRQGVLLVQGYGLTESAPVITTCTRAAQRIGTVGPPLTDVEVRIADDGEVLTRGPHVMLGYWKKPTATAEAIRDGWLHTGDLGALEDGFLRITGRKKELLVLTSGKNIAPSLLERLLCDDPLIAQAMVVGDGRNYLTALIVPDPENLKSEISNLKLSIASPEEALTHPQVCASYRQCIDARLAELSPQEQVGKFTLIGRAFSVADEELTPTLKLRRSIIVAHFNAEIAAMYAAAPRA